MDGFWSWAGRWQAGSYTVTLTVTDQDGTTATTSQTVTVGP